MTLNKYFVRKRRKYRSDHCIIDRIQSLLKISIKNINEIYINKISLYITIFETLPTINPTLIMILKLLTRGVRFELVWVFSKTFSKFISKPFNIVLTRRRTDREEKLQTFRLRDSALHGGSMLDILRLFQ